MVRQVRLTLEKLLEKVLESNGDYNEKYFQYRRMVIRKRKSLVRDNLCCFVAIQAKSELGWVCFVHCAHVFIFVVFSICITQQINY